MALGRGMKRTLLVPIWLFLVVLTGTSWFYYLQGSRAAVLLGADSLALATAERLADGLDAYLAVPATLAAANAAIAASPDDFSGGPLDWSGLFADQLAAFSSVDIVCVGFADGEYREAQRLDSGELRQGVAGRSTGGRLVLYRPSVRGDRLDQDVGNYDPRQRPWYRTAVESDGLVWSRPYAYVSTGRYAIAAMSAWRAPDGTAEGVASVTVRLEGLSAYLDDVRASSDGFAALVEPDGAAVAATDPVRWGGDAAAAARLTAAVLANTPGRSAASTVDGRRWRTALIAYGLGSADWRLVVALPESRFLAPLAANDCFVVLAHFIGLLLFFLMSYLLADSVTAPLRRLAGVVAVLDIGGTPDGAGGGDPVLDALAARGDEIGALASAFRTGRARLSASFAGLRRSLADKDVLLREVHHRVKNNLQIVSSLLSLHASESGDPAVVSAMEDLRSRVFAMALVHETIYSSGDFAAVPMDEYLERLSRSLRLSNQSGSAILVSTAAAGVRLPLEQAIPCALIAVELISNAFKHAFGGRESGRVDVALVADGDAWRLEVADDGVGLGAAYAAREAPPSGAAPSPEAPAILGHGMGSLLIDALSRQLGGRCVTETSAAGTRVSLRFPQIA
jgi:two-component sensor histidine kinase